MTESTLLPPVVGEDDKATQLVTVELGPSDPEPGAAERVDGAEAAPEAQTASAMPPALDAVTCAELLAAQELTTVTPGETPPRADEKMAAPGLEEAMSPSAGTAEPATKASAVGAPVAEDPPAETDSGTGPSPVEAAAPFPAEEGSSWSLTAALDTAPRLTADANVAIEAAAPAPAGEEPVADPPPADADKALDEPAIGPAPTAAAAAGDGVPSLTRALETAAQVAADAEAGAVAEPVGSQPVPERRSAGPDPNDPAPAPGFEPPPALAAEANVQPLTSALGAAAKLAADANAAAEALENLQRLLQRQLPGVAAGLATPAPSADGAAWTAAPTERAKPPPLPAMPSSNEPRTAGPPDYERQLPVPLPPRRAPERARLDVRGFLAGFALSWAFGVVLYLFMTAG